jgi:hypothetical protein
MFNFSINNIDMTKSLGHYDSKPYHSIEYALIYANETLVLEDENCKVFSRVYKGTTFVNILVNEEIGLNIDKYQYLNIKKFIEEKGLEATNKSICFMVFKNDNENTISLAKKFCNSTKTSFEQAVVYNSEKVRLEYYKPVPTFYKLYDHFCENLYFDIAAIDPFRE